MNIFKKVLKLISNRTSKLKNNDNIEKISELEKFYSKYETFEISQNNVKYLITLLFTEDIENSKKIEIYNFTKDAFVENTDISMIIINIGMIFELLVTAKGCPDTNELKLFIGNIDLNL